MVLSDTATKSIFRLFDIESFISLHLSHVAQLFCLGGLSIMHKGETCNKMSNGGALPRERFVGDDADCGHFYV